MKPGRIEAEKKLGRLEEYQSARTVCQARRLQLEVSREEIEKKKGPRGRFRATSTALYPDPKSGIGGSLKNSDKKEMQRSAGV